MSELGKFLVEEKKKEFSETNKVLDALRKTRPSRPPETLDVPRHLKDAIIITDADTRGPAKPKMVDEDVPVQRRR